MIHRVLNYLHFSKPGAYFEDAIRQRHTRDTITIGQDEYIPGSTDNSFGKRITTAAITGFASQQNAVIRTIANQRHAVVDEICHKNFM